jgi:hypothetical protein
MVTGDSRFGAEIRGRLALRRWLQKLRPGVDLDRAARDLLTQRQRSEFLWDLPCALCGSRPEGPVKRIDACVVEFRCPTGECGARPYAGPGLQSPPPQAEAATQDLPGGVPLSRRGESDGHGA